MELEMMKKKEIPILRIRRPRDNEIPRIGKAFLDVLREIPYYNALAKKEESKKYTVSKLKEKIVEDRYSVVCAINDKHEVVGLLFNHFDDYTIWIDWIGVRKDQRRKGIAQQLLMDLLRTAKLRGCHKIWCDCRTTNEPSKAALAKAGFRKIAEIRNHWYGQDFILWERFIV
jgi:RimJ/RimL family protein N-acetyltransferase